MQGEHLRLTHGMMEGRKGNEKEWRRAHIVLCELIINIYKKKDMYLETERRRREKKKLCENLVLFRCKPPLKERGRGGGTKLKYKKVTIFPVKI